VSFPSLAPQTYAQQLGMSRYTAEFEEEAVIGKGAYGEVYRVRNHVDGQLYAVKKIPLSARRLKQLQEGGMPELDNILKEIRTLARLEHQNVVRYFAAWAEYSKSPRTAMSADFSAAVARMTGRPPGPTGLLSQVSANEEVSISITFEEESNQGIVFEESGSHIVFGDSSVSALADPTSTTNPITAASTSPEGENAANSEETSGDDDEAEVDDEEEDVESISRRLTQSQMLGSSGDDDDIFSDGLGGLRSQKQFDRPLAVDTQLPSITLHIQMSLHPLNLAQYLSAQAGANITNNPHHCFHLLPSLRIMFGILAGVEYLHIKGIIHRDLKPANIFLSLPDGDVDKESDKCSACKATGHCPPCYTVPRIGDFGLVADTSPLDEQPSDAESARPVGTEFYRPPVMPMRSRRSSSAQQPMESPQAEEEEEAELVPTPDETLDVFALGVILFELLYKLDTRMERQMVLSELTCSRNCREQPKLPDDFKRTIERCVRTSCPSSSEQLEGDLSRIPEHITRCILGMIEPDARRRWTCKEVRRCLEEVFAIVRENDSS
jgi:translation initiation factor 2-alpha kinase 3